MNTIHFNKKYTKLPDGIKTAVLLCCEPVKLLDLTDTFLQYDTQFRTPMVFHYDKLYSDYIRCLNEDMLCLILKSDTGAIFTTLRKDNPENREKYMGNYIGGGQFEKHRPEFDIIIQENNDERE